MKITIFWFAWSWTSTIWKLLAKELDYKFMSSWNIMRSWALDLGLSIYEFEETVVKNDSNFDIKLDNQVEEFWKKNDNFIFESRLAWNFIPDSYKIYLKCDEKIRYNRIESREWISLEEVIEKNSKREEWVEKRYLEVYPEINFPPKENIFDLVIDADNLSPEQIIKLILGKVNI